MGKTVILCMSVMGSQAQERTYGCPDGGQVTGVQTNEAPVKYLLRKYGKQITHILCVVSGACRETVEGKTFSSLDHFRQEIERFCGEENLAVSKDFITEIDFREDSGADEEAALLRNVSQKLGPEDEILLETTGGFRNSVVLLLLLSRMLSYTGHKTACAVYSFLDRTNSGGDRIIDVSDMVSLFDLIGGMQELSSFGNVRTLQKYYDAHPGDGKVRALLTATEYLLDNITLCRTSRIDEAVEKFNKAMSEAAECSDPLLPELLPAFRLKYGKKLTIPGVILWCVNSDMVQQALTIYKENIPGYLLSRGDVLEVRPGTPLPSQKPVYQGDSEAHFRAFIDSTNFFNDALSGRRENWTSDTVRADYRLKCRFEKMCNIALDYSYLLLLRNMTNHASDTVDGSKEDKARKLNEYDASRYPLPENTSTRDVKAAILGGLDHMKH